ncbi:molybdenum cofactor sulfurase [Roseibium denhamense]|uniref:MOSC domain-containing protein n=1 Tax=Roseibium denhamense TaxID=76305 RepID=A0ABY1PN04_9HYPH|nr:molybdenum cofactor sulfurase [Roseibium denhamense]MTI04227.1 molybdenum cofactor sulfurase [Roseibium denhamense]SMP36863.1 hypothetical protein SAMN06265374_4346 [Roseibium denhamense]
MAEQLGLLGKDVTMTRKFKVTGRVDGVYQTTRPEDFQTAKVDALEVTFEGIPGDRHGGHTRKSGGREPWYPRGTEMCNERQISILSDEELHQIAARMDIPELKSEWIGGNILLSGIPQLSLVPPRTRLEFEGGVVIRIDGDNVPCRIAGTGIAGNFPGREGLDLLFPKVARRLRGLVGFIEIPGIIRAGETATAHIPEQWVYQPE